MDETEVQSDEEQEKDDDEDDTKLSDDLSMNAESDSKFTEDDASMTDDTESKPIIKVDEPEVKKFKGDESLEGNDEMKSEGTASFSSDLEQDRNDVGVDGSSDITNTFLNDEEKAISLEDRK